MDLTRRSFLRGVGAAAAFAHPFSSRTPAAPLPHPRGGRLGPELYSVRNELKKDLGGTLKLVRSWGFEEVELAGFPPMSAQETARVLRTAGLRAVSQFVDYERLQDDLAGGVGDAHALGLETVICGWIPHEKVLTRADTDAAIASVNKWG